MNQQQALSYGKSPLLWRYADREHKYESVKYELRVSDGPLDTYSKIPFQFDPAKLAVSYHGGGTHELRQEMAPHYGVDPDQFVVINGGASQANHTVINALLQKSDPVLVEYPVYDPLAEAAAVAVGGHDTVFRLPRRSENNFQIDLEEFETLLKQHNPRLVIVTNLHNPTCVPLNNLQQLISIVDKHNQQTNTSDRKTYLLVDEAYRELATNPIRCAASSAGHLDPSHSRWVVATTGLSKGFGLSGLRCGVIVAGDLNIMKLILGYYTISGVCNSSLQESLWRQFYSVRESLLTDHLRPFQRERQKRVLEFFQKANIPVCGPPGGGSCLMIPLPKTSQKNPDVAFVSMAIKEFDVGVTPGSLFGLENHIRLAYLNIPSDLLEPALEAFSKAYYSVAKGDQ